MSEHEAPSAIMWAVNGDDDVMCVGDSEAHAWAVSEILYGWTRDSATLAGYRCIRVKVTEVGDGA